MPTLTGKITDLGITDLDARGVVEATVETQVDGYVGADNALHLDKLQATTSGGVLTITDLPDTSQIENLRLRLHLNYIAVGPGGIKKRSTFTSGWFEATDDLTLADVVDSSIPNAPAITSVAGAVTEATTAATTATTAKTDALAAQAAAEAARDEAASITAPLTAPANEQVASYITNPGAAQTELDARYATYVTPQNFGAKGDGTTDDTTAVQAALDDPRPVFFPAGTYLVGNLTDTTGKGLYGGGMNASRLLAKPGTTGTLYTCQNIAGKPISDLWFDGNGTVATVLDTDWNLGNGPSQGNVYANLRVSGYTALAWTALNNNDSPFRNILIEAGTSTATRSLVIIAAGGMIELDACRFNLPWEWCAQIAVVNGGYFLGCHIADNSYNVLQVSGSYWYAGPTTHECLSIDAGVSCKDVTFSGTHLENAYSDGVVLGGPGSIAGVTKFVGGHIFSTVASGTVRLVGSDLGNDGPTARVRTISVFCEGVDLTSSPAGIRIHVENTVNTGLFAPPSHGVIDSGAGDSEDIFTGHGIDHWNAGIGTTHVLKRSIVSIAHAGTGVLTDLPRSGLMNIRTNVWDGPALLVHYSRIGQETGQITVLASQPGPDGQTLTVSIPVANAQTTFGTDVTVALSDGTAHRDLIVSAAVLGF